MSRWTRTSASVDRALKSIHRQGIGRVPAIPAEDVRPGMLLSWNYSPHGYKVIAVRNLSARYLEITEANRETGEVFRRRVERERLIAAEWPKKRDPSRRHHHRTPGAPTFAQQEAIARKVRLLRREGYPEKQAVAIAYRTADVRPRKTRRS